MLLSEMPIETIRAPKGVLKVKSIVNGRIGKVIYVSDKILTEDYDIGIEWEVVGLHIAWHFACNKIEVIE